MDLLNNIHEIGIVPVVVLKSVDETRKIITRSIK